ncbi:glycoside hydrolase family 2 protein [Leifsonia sp. SIMBA_070]|uniref:glycoside hydrolase family 2 protein n=1 Tax=Leifsonia sp. SIMBA_070 TaxID=3085810 RepID=UPI00397DB2C4
MTYLSLDGEWTLTAVEGPVPHEIAGRTIAAQVPGCAHTDLLRSGLIAAPFDGDNEAAQQWIGSTTWRYERSFDWSPADDARSDLVALGLDTLATISVNGTVVALTRNQHRSYRFPIAHLLRAGTNTIAVEFEAPVEAAERIAAEHGGALPHVNHHPYNSLRKTASNFGWDWGIDVATSGIWKSIGIDGWSDVRIDRVRPLVDVVSGAGILRAHVALDRIGDPAATTRVTATVSRNGRTVAETTGRIAAEGVLELAVPDAELWWPVGHGDQPLYDVVIVAGDDEWTGRVGFRTVELDTSTDADGNRFVLSVNGEPVWIRGANWIPDHAFATEITPDRLSRRIDDALEANMNLLRVWGGGMYESDDFYRICDERGVLVWQDFLLACAAYAEEEWLSTEIVAEAREAVTRLSPHPSLVLWNGNNENIIAFAEWGWRARLHGRSWGNGYYRELLPAIVAELDPTRPYSPGSPYSFDDYLNPNDDKNGTVHIWDVWNQKDYTAYREWKPRFVSEFGFQGPPAWTTLTEVVHDEPLDPYGHEMLVHQKADEGNAKLARGYAGHLPEPRTIDDWHVTTQLNQAHAIRFGIEYFRSLTPYNTGTIVWQLNDDWPVVSWAAVDFAERRKPLWYALRQAYRERLVTIQPAAGRSGSDGLEAIVVNDTADAWSGDLLVERRSFDGATIASTRVHLDVAPRSVAAFSLPEEVVASGAPRSEILVATPDDGSARAVWNYVEPVEQELHPDPLEARAESTANGARIVVTARAYVRDITVLADRAHPEATVDDSLVTLLAGESAVFELTAPQPIDVDAALSPLVLRHVNELLAAAAATVGA